ncbi:MAG TPA: uroporphyrinogen-III C-methyltransferase [Candidatus Rubrimentiphilum sp.]|nr:uroporphyrinogen-III C-methyltransferase [Candidatus Rubrimentiphilum sp.]
MPTGKVFLTGAGPGDPGLLTLRAREALRRADVLLYDALASDAIVDLVSPACERIYAGKRGGAESVAQGEIETLMIERARAGKTVVRLKGGDPFLFGRGGEEAQALHAAGIDFEIVPGISSALAAPAYAGIPVTHRDHNTVLTIVSGHEDPAKESSAIDWQRLSDPKQTLVFLMAMRNLRDVAANLMRGGLPADHPAAVVANGTRPSQRTVTGTLATIAGDAEREGLSAPAIVIVGTVVSLRDAVAWFEKLPLFGKRVLMTRPAGSHDDLAQALTRAGAEPVAAPTIAIVPPDDAAAAERATHDPAQYSWVVFTSANGVRVFFDYLEARRDDARIFGGAKIAAIGLKTSQALLRRSVRADAVPQRYIAEDLADLLIASSREGDRILLYRAQEARDVLPDRLNAAGRPVTVVAAYKTVFTDDAGFGARVAGCDIVTFTSASTVNGFVHNLGSPQAAREACAEKVVACIGPIAAQAAKDAGLPVHVIAAEFTVEGLVGALS